MYIMSPALPLQLHHYTGVEDTALHLGFTVAVPAAAAVGGEVHDTGASSRCTGGCRRDGPGSIVSAQPPQRLPRQSVSQSPTAPHVQDTPLAHSRVISGQPLSSGPLSFSLCFSLSISLFPRGGGASVVEHTYPPPRSSAVPFCVVIGSFFRLELSPLLPRCFHVKPVSATGPPLF